MGVQSASRVLFIVAALGASCAPSSIMSSSSSLSSSPPPSSSAPAISHITPSKSPVGTRVTITGSGFASKGNTVKFGDGYIRDVESANGTTLRFEVPGGLDLCSPDPKGPCKGGFPRVAAGDYAVAVMAKGETSNSVMFTVTEQ